MITANEYRDSNQEGHLDEIGVLKNYRLTQWNSSNHTRNQTATEKVTRKERGAIGILVEK